MSHDLLGVMVRARAHPVQQDRFGVVLLATLAKGLLTGARKGAGWLKSPEGQRQLSKLKVTAESEQKRIASYEEKLAQEKDPVARKRWEDRLVKARARYEDMRLEERLAAEGIVGEGPVLEVKRNLLASRWEDADDARKAEIEKQIADMDVKIRRLVTEQKLIAVQRGEAVGVTRPVSAVKVYGSPARRATIPSRGSRFEKGVYGIGTQLAEGMGGLTFRRFSPPGPGRLVPIPMYPQAAQSWIGATGIEEPGDDPVLCARVIFGARTAGPYLLRSRTLDWGRFRLVGVLTQDQPVVLSHSPPINPPDTNLFTGCFSLSGLRVYNDRNIFVQEDQVAAWDFTVLPAGYKLNSTTLLGGGSMVDDALRYSQGLHWNTQYAGLRNYPVVNDSSQVSVEVNVFTPIANAGANDVQIPFVCFLLAEIVEDDLIGDPAVLSPASRPGANMKLGAREVDTDGVMTRYEIQSAGYWPRGR